LELIQGTAVNNLGEDYLKCAKPGFGKKAGHCLYLYHNLCFAFSQYCGIPGIEIRLLSQKAGYPETESL